MEPEEFDQDLDLDEGWGEDWDEESLGLDLDETDALSVARELGVPLGR
ncbi:MAG TPA: hypothetical protein VM489_04450 [Burkholderiales bacterium]|nr:hypothetical protein [Burkholderiales bacterium]